MSGGLPQPITDLVVKSLWIGRLHDPRVIAQAVEELRPVGLSVDRLELVALEGTDTEDNSATAERRTAIDPTLAGAIAASQCRLAPRPGLEPGTCGLTVRPVNPRKAAPGNDPTKTAGNIFG
jgi:hypothetical protein